MAEKDTTLASEEEIHTAIADLEGISPDELAAAMAAEEAADSAGETAAEAEAGLSANVSLASNADAEGTEPAGTASAVEPAAEASETPPAEVHSEDESPEAGPASNFAKRIRARLRRVASGLPGVLARLRGFRTPAPGDAAAKTSPQESPTAGVLYRTLDGTLDALNRPLARFGDATRNAIGLAAMVTVVLSLVVLLLSPYLFPRRAPVTFLKEKRAQLEQRPGRSPPPEPPAAEPRVSEPSADGD